MTVSSSTADRGWVVTGQTAVVARRRRAARLLAAWAAVLVALTALPVVPAQAYGGASVFLGNDTAEFPGGHVMAQFSCDAGWRSQAVIWWSDTEPSEPYVDPGTVTVLNPPEHFSRLVTAPVVMQDGSTSAGRHLQLNLTCRDGYGNEQSATEPIYIVASSGCPESITWARPGRPLRMTITAASAVRRTSSMVVTVTARNTSRVTWRGRLGFASAPATDSWQSMANLGAVRVGRTTLRPACLQAAPGGRIPLYLVRAVIRPGKAVTVRFSVVPGRSVRATRIQLFSMRGTAQANGTPGWFTTTSLT